MYATGTKKMLPLMILDILRKRSDENHQLTQKKMIEYLKLDYGMECDRRSVKVNIDILKEFEYEIEYKNGYYLERRDFEDVELRLLIDTVLFSHNLTEEQASRLIDKLKKQASEHFKGKIRHILDLDKLQHGNNPVLMLNLDIISDAIEKKCQIEFTYQDYGTDGQLHPRREKSYHVNPYQMVISVGHYYLICQTIGYNDISHYRIDRMKNVSKTDITFHENPNVGGNFNLPNHMAEHIYMLCGKTVHVTLRMSVDMMNDLIDWFGHNYRITKQKDSWIDVSVRTNENAMFYWALQYGPYVEVLEPKSLREKIRDSVINMQKKYTNLP